MNPTPDIIKKAMREFDEKFTLLSKQGKRFIGYMITEEELIKNIKSFIEQSLSSYKSQIIKEVDEKFIIASFNGDDEDYWIIKKKDWNKIIDQMGATIKSFLK